MSIGGFKKKSPAFGKFKRLYSLNYGTYKVLSYFWGYLPGIADIGTIKFDQMTSGIYHPDFEILRDHFTKEREYDFGHILAIM